MAAASAFDSIMESNPQYSALRSSTLDSVMSHVGDGAALEDSVRSATAAVPAIAEHGTSGISPGMPIGTAVAPGSVRDTVVAAATDPSLNPNENFFFHKGDVSRSGLVEQNAQLDGFIAATHGNNALSDLFVSPIPESGASLATGFTGALGNTAPVMPKDEQIQAWRNTHNAAPVGSEANPRQVAPVTVSATTTELREDAYPNPDGTYGNE